MARRLTQSAFRKPGPKLTAFLWGLLAFGLLPFLLFCFLWVGIPMETRGPIRSGVTFSVPQAESLGLDWRETLTASLDDMGVRLFRIPAYWNRLEEHRGTFDWTELDWQMDEIEKRGGKVMLAIGLKTPRWPECWWPDWAKNLPEAEGHDARLAYMAAVVQRYRVHPALESWQVENEPTFEFGICPKPSKEFFIHEVGFVKALNGFHPLVTTDSGELATWLETGPLVERLGVSVYRVVRTPWGWVWPYDWIPPYWYFRRALLVSPWVKDVFVSEFQMEPWFERHPLDTPIAEQMETFDLDRMQSNFRFAEQMQINEIYFWGVEWWYWMNVKQNDPSFWGVANAFFQKHQIP